MPSLVATTSALAWKPCVSTHYVRTNNSSVPGEIMLQETKVKKEGKLKLANFTVFEKMRENNEGGGLMTIVHDNMKPILIPDEHSEFLEVNISGNFGYIRTINCYGPQENQSLDFFTELESRIISAKENQN